MVVGPFGKPEHTGSILISIVYADEDSFISTIPHFRIKIGSSNWWAKRMLMWKVCLAI